MVEEDFSVDGLVGGLDVERARDVERAVYGGVGRDDRRALRMDTLYRALDTVTGGRVGGRTSPRIGLFAEYTLSEPNTTWPSSLENTCVNSGRFVSNALTRNGALVRLWTGKNTTTVNLRSSAGNHVLGLCVANTSQYCEFKRARRDGTYEDGYAPLVRRRLGQADVHRP